MNDVYTPRHRAKIATAGLVSILAGAALSHHAIYNQMPYRGHPVTAEIHALTLRSQDMELGTAQRDSAREQIHAKLENKAERKIYFAAIDATSNTLLGTSMVLLGLIGVAAAASRKVYKGIFYER